MQFRSRDRKLYKGLIAGSIGGLAASWIMVRFQVALSRAVSGSSNPHEGEEEDATVKTAEKISEGVLDRPLSPEGKKTAGPVVHYAYGTGLGALYGGLTKKFEGAKSGFGSGYGAAVWAIGDEVMVPAFGLGRWPTETPVSQQIQALAAHLVYGVTLEGVRRLTLKLL
jgi:hypothetical protein